jgi:subtilisin family serine protease
MKGGLTGEWWAAGVAAQAIVCAVATAALAGPARLGAVAGPAGVASGGDRQGDPALAAAHLAARTPSRLILKLRDGIDTCLSCELAARRRLGALVLGSRLDELNQQYGVRRAKPLLRAHAVGLAPESGSAAARRRGRLRQRFPARARRAPAGAVAPDLSRAYVLQLRRRPDMEAVAQAYSADPAVEYCEPDRIVEVTATTNDPFLSSQGSWQQSFDDLWGVKRIGAPTAWNITRGAGVVVAVIDTGVDYTHPDIAASMWANAGEIAANGLDDDGNGYVDDMRGWDFAADDSDPLDDHGHGTHVAGTIAAVGENGLGIVGVAYESRIMALRGLGTAGLGSTSDLVNTIEYAIDNGADVINASWSGSGTSQAMSDVLAAARAAGVVFVAAAGNSGRDVAGEFPANDVNSIAVAAFNHDDVRASFSNFGLGIDVAAPGGGDLPPPEAEFFPSASILSLHSAAIAPGGEFNSKLILEQGGAEYLRLAGTSMAAPHVAGVAALVLSADPSLSPDEVRQVLRATAKDVGDPGPDDDSGYGLVDSAAAVVAGPPLVARIESPRNEKLVGEVSVAITGTAGGPGFEFYALDYRPADTPGAWTAVAGPVTGEVVDGTLATWAVSDIDDGDYVLRLTAVRGGEQFIDRVALTLSTIEIARPRPLEVVRAAGTLDIVGTAAGRGFTGYTVEYKRPAVDPDLWRTDGLALAAQPGTPVRNGVLATLDVSDLSEGGRFDFRLTVEGAVGTRVFRRSGIAVDPTIRAGWPQQLLPGSDAEYLTVSDLDGDGIQEILVGSGDEVIVFEPDGSVRRGWPQSVATDDFPFVSTRGSPIVADVAGDPSPEVIATNRKQILAWTADGALLDGFPVTVDVFVTGMNDWITAGDRDGDGKDEIICTGVRGIAIYRGDGSELPDSAIASRFGVAASAAGDIDGDGRVEIARFDELKLPANLGRLEVLDPAGTSIASAMTKVKFFPHVSMADLDGDGRMDFHVVQENRRRTRMKLRAYDLDGRRVRSARVRAPRGGATDWVNSQLSFADVNEDGKVEAYAYSSRFAKDRSENQVGFFVPYQSRDGIVFRDAPSHQLFRYLLTGGIAIGDVDGDGIQELVAGAFENGCGVAACAWASTDGPVPIVRRGVVVQRIDGSLLAKFPKPLSQFSLDDDGREASGTITIFSSVDDLRANTPSIADLDGDGLKEVLWVDPGTTRLFVWDVEGTPGALVADWPGYHGDPKHSNVFPLGGR